MVSPYLSFIPILSTLRIFELNEVVRGRLIDPKTWDQIVRIFFGIFPSSMAVHKISWAACVKCLNCALKSMPDMKKVGNGRETRVHKVNQ